MHAFARWVGRALAVSLSWALVACGGGGGTSNAPQAQPQAVQFPASDNEAQRFLTQATFGPTDDDVAQVRMLGFGPWIDAQLQAQPTVSHLAFWQDRQTDLSANKSAASLYEVNHSFWAHAIAGPDQLRQRVALALSEIFVISSQADCVGGSPPGVASYLDMLGNNAFGPFRTLLEKVSRHPTMGCYLSHLRNQRENPVSGRVPDENYAREVMQLFTIGLYQLHADGTLVLDADGHPIETYRPADVSGLAKVFTGFSWDCPDRPADACFYSGSANGNSYADRWGRDMFGYEQFHSRSQKDFLGVSIAAADHASPDQDLKTALDFLALSHPNVGPFLGKQLIQRLVTSNPSPAYVGRVTAAFEASGRNLGAMVKAILLDPEARDMAAAQASDTFGKVREPLLRLSAFLRAAGASSDTGHWQIDFTDDAYNLAQTALRAPSVFNFFRPGYVMPGGQSAARGLVAPELQIANESNAAGYVNFMRDVVSAGVGRSQTNAAKQTRRDVQPRYLLDTTNPWYQLAASRDAGPLIEQVNQKLMYGTLPAALRDDMKAVLDADPLAIGPKVSTPSEALVRNRLNAAWLMALASPEFLIQK